MLILFEKHVLNSEGDGWHLSLYQMTLGRGISLSSIGVTGTCVRKVSESERASLSVSLVSFERWSSSYRVIQAEILARCALMSKRKGALSPFGGSFFNDLSNQISFCFPLSNGGGCAEAWTGAVVPDVIDCCVSWGVWSYCRRYNFPGRVPISCEVAGFATKASFSSSESLREVIVTASSSVAREMTLHD